MPAGLKDRGGSRTRCWEETEQGSLRSPLPPLWGLGREQALAGHEEFTLGHMFEVGQDTCPWVRTWDHRDNEEGGSLGVWVGGRSWESV